MRRPNFFIVGASKSGTSSLWRYLCANPEVFMPTDVLDKEPAFFSPLKCRRSYRQYADLFAGAEDRHIRVGEASTAYLTDPSSARNIFNFNPHSNILIILRNPADRAYSMFNWMAQEGYEYALNFKQALRLERKRSAKKIPNYWEPEYYWDYMYVRSGLYHDQVKRYLDLFGDQVRVMKFDDFVADFETVYAGICRFLGISVNPVVPEIHNPSRSVYLPTIQFGLRKLYTRMLLFRMKHSGYRYTSKDDRDRLLKIGVRRSRPSRIDSDLRRDLLDRFRHDIYRLTDLTGISFNEWTDE